jgi:holliday junction DNA helicase RuvB
MTGLEQIVGQGEIVKRLQILAIHFRARGEPADHLMLVGPDGMEKSTIARALGATLGAAVKGCHADLLEKKGDLTAILTSLDPRAVLLLENAHHLRQPLSESCSPR